MKTYADASQVGSPEGQNEEATTSSDAAILELAPNFSMRTLKQAQTTLLGMGAEAESETLIGTHYGSRKWEDGLLHYGLVAVETARCKGGKKIKLGVHTGALTERGHRFPAQVKAEALEATRAGWSLPLSKKCKVEQELEVFVSEAPFADVAALNAWNLTQVETLEDRVAKKRIDTAEELPVSLD